MREPSSKEGGLPITRKRPSRPTARFQVHFFGLFRIIREKQVLGEPIWRRSKSKALLKWFLLNENRMFSVDQLIKNFWPAVTRTSAERNFHVAIHYLRHLLEPDLPPRHESHFIRRNKDNLYWLELDNDWWVDIFDVQYHHAEGKEAEQQGEWQEAIMHYSQIVEYCNQGFLSEDTYEDIFTPYRRHYQRIHTEVLERLMYLSLQANMIENVLTYAHSALLVDPFCEPAVRAIAASYFRQGNSVAALRQLDHFQAFLKAELGVDAGESVLSLRKKIAEMEGE